MTADAEPIVAVGTVITDDNSGYPFVRTVGGWMRVGWERSKSWAQVLEWHQEAIDNPDDDTVEPFKPVIMVPAVDGQLMTDDAERLAAIRERVQKLLRDSEGWLNADEVGTIEGLLAIAAEHDALRARIEAALTIIRRDLAGSVARSLTAALAGDQPEATPETVGEMCDHYRGANEGCPAGCFAPTEPPHLDPEPWESPSGKRYRVQGNEYWWRRFAPRPEFEQDRAAYGVQS